MSSACNRSRPAPVAHPSPAQSWAPPALTFLGLHGLLRSSWAVVSRSVRFPCPVQVAESQLGSAPGWDRTCQWHTATAPLQQSEPFKLQAGPRAGQGRCRSALPPAPQCNKAAGMLMDTTRGLPQHWVTQQPCLMGPERPSSSAEPALGTGSAGKVTAFFLAGIDKRALAG